MRELTTWGTPSALLAGLVVVGSLSLLATDPGIHETMSMDFWEAYGRGLVSVTIEDRTYQRGETTVTLPVGIRVGNRADVPVVLSEEAVLMSPSSVESPVPDPGSTTQDAILTTATIPAGGSLVYSYGEEALRGYLPDPVWWCSEEYQFARAGTSMVVAGETLPFVLRPLAANRHWESADSNTQADLWWFLRTHATVVVGKDPLWSTLLTGEGQRLEVRVRATNLAVFTYDDDYGTDVNVSAGALVDTVPSGWTVEEGSYSVAPDEVVRHEDGSQTLRWIVDLPAALEGGDEDLRLPTAYETVERSYALVSPALRTGVHILPRAASDMDRDGAWDAHSAPIRIEAVPTTRAVVAEAGGPYVGWEGDVVRLDASRSTASDGAALSYRWDHTADGTFDTAWSTDPTAEVRYADDFLGFARLQATDGDTITEDLAAVSIGNRPPEILDLTAVARADFRLEVAGERWHDVSLTIVQGTDVVSVVRVVRGPGSPSEQGVGTGPLDVPLDASFAATIMYTPLDDGVNGQPEGDNPAWLVLTLPDGTDVRRSHNFNVRFTSTWTWTLGDLGAILASSGLTLRAHVREPGADDLEARWDFGDGTVASERLEGAGTAPFDVLLSAVHPYGGPGDYRVTLTVVDDDGGQAVAALVVRVA